MTVAELNAYDPEMELKFPDGKPVKSCYVADSALVLSGVDRGSYMEATGNAIPPSSNLAQEIADAIVAEGIQGDELKILQIVTRVIASRS